MAESVSRPAEVIGSTDEESLAAQGSKELMVTMTAERSEVRAPSSNGADDSPPPADVCPEEEQEAASGDGVATREEQSASVGGASDPGDAS